MLASSIFEGAAFYYARYQPEYPHELFRSLSEHLLLTPESRVLDLGCGTGQIGLGLAPGVGHVDCVDPNRAMLGEADRLSSERGLLNISLIESTAEEMDSGLTGYQGATIASAFHWMDRSLVLETLDRRLLSSGKVAIITRIRDETAPSDWWNRIWDFVHTWWGGYFPPDVAISAANYVWITTLFCADRRFRTSQGATSLTWYHGPPRNSFNICIPHQRPVQVY
ncbi:class I SAM-dependent methyltransferase [Bradyrhizobium sp. BR 1432]|uniref:class I SAM-dependent methyltransferase n=1 Tax=Bradyrhizobium sp. BR 1432 TaxID=3447966 RepID=UPI003EE71C66